MPRHGTNACYTLTGCRLPACRTAHATADRTHRRLTAHRQHGAATPAYVDAAPVRAHARHLMTAGMGYRHLARLARVNDGTLIRLLYGHSGRAPSSRIRPSTARRILAVRPDHADHGLLDSTGTQRRIQALVALGWTLAQVAQMLDRPVSSLQQVLRRPRVQTRTARAVSGLFERLWNTRPPECTARARAVAEGTRRRAAALGWVVAAWWDDDEIDDPKARPHCQTRRLSATA